MTASRLTIGLLFGSFARSGYRVNKVCKEKRLATVPLLIRSNYSRVLKERVETFDSPLTLVKIPFHRETLFQPFFNSIKVAGKKITINIFERDQRDRSLETPPLDR